MSDFDPAAYGSVFAELLAEERLNPLGPGTPNLALRERLESLNAAETFGHVSMADRAYADACLAGVWLYHDFLDESHTISQRIGNATGSYWHAIMHRREGDFGNSKYWFRRVGMHPVFEPLSREAMQLARRQGDLPVEAEYLTELGDWDPHRFVDLCQRFVGTGLEDELFVQRVQLAEWQLLFDDCYRRALAV